MIGGTDVEAPKPIYEVVADTNKHEVVHDRTKNVTAPKFPFQSAYKHPATGDRAGRAGGVADLEGQPLFRPELRQPALGIPAGRRNHRTSR